MVFVLPVLKKCIEFYVILQLPLNILEGYGTLQDQLALKKKRSSEGSGKHSPSPDPMVKYLLSMVSMQVTNSQTHGPALQEQKPVGR